MHAHGERAYQPWNEAIKFVCSFPASKYYAAIATVSKYLQLYDVSLGEFLTNKYGNVESYPGEKGASQEDIKFLHKAEQEIEQRDGHFMQPLPFRDIEPSMLLLREEQHP